jgi:hypothetical protein
MGIFLEKFVETQLYFGQNNKMRQESENEYSFVEVSTRKQSVSLSDLGLPV